MENLDSLLFGFATVMTPTNLAYCFIGVFLGTFTGVLPGIGSIAAVSLLLPVTFQLEPTTAMVMLAGVYYGSEYGGSTASILLNLPGTASNAVTCLDGYPMAQQGRAGVALFVTTIVSFIGGAVGIVILIMLSPLVVRITLSFGPSEYFALLTFGLLAAATIAQGSPVKGVAMVVLGLLLGCIGADVNSGVVRYDLGFFELYDGLSIVVVAMGLFGVSEIIASANAPRPASFARRISFRSMVPTREDVRRSAWPTARGTAIGSLFGALPGTGPMTSSFISYAVEKRVARDPSRFGKGAIEGIAAPEASNNAAAQTAFVPTLAMGIPGTATMALMLGALMIHGIVPGPQLMRSHPDVFWGLIASFWIGNVLLLVLNIPLIGLWVRLLHIPYHLLFPVVVCLICVSVYAISNNSFDIALVLGFGLLGYVLRQLGYEMAPLIVGFVLGPPLEVNLRRALIIADGDFGVVLQRPITATLLAFSAALLLWAAVQLARRPKPPGRTESSGTAKGPAAPG